jgi:hypothetical protein
MEMETTDSVGLMAVVEVAEPVTLAKSAAVESASVFPTVPGETVEMMAVVETLAEFAPPPKLAPMDNVLELQSLNAQAEFVEATEPEEAVEAVQMDKDAEEEFVSVSMTVMTEFVEMPSNLLEPTLDSAPPDLVDLAPLDSLVTKPLVCVPLLNNVMLQLLSKTVIPEPPSKMDWLQFKSLEFPWLTVEALAFPKELVDGSMVVLEATASAPALEPLILLTLKQSPSLELPTK